MRAAVGVSLQLLTELGARIFNSRSSHQGVALTLQA